MKNNQQGAHDKLSPTDEKGAATPTLPPEGFSGLAKAIREGAKLRPQGFDAFFIDEPSPLDPTVNITCSCVLGAAYEYLEQEDDVTGDDPDDIESVLTFNFPVLSADVSWACPHQNCVEAHDNTLFNLITMLNDDHKWKREEIADWLDTLEPETSGAPREPQPARS